MSDRSIDPTRQGLAHEPEPIDFVSAPPVSLEEALAAVEAWMGVPGVPLFGIHQQAIALRNAYVALRDALPTIVACADGRGLECGFGPWAPCCITRRRICAVLNRPVKAVKMEFG